MWLQKPKATDGSIKYAISHFCILAIGHHASTPPSVMSKRNFEVPTWSFKAKHPDAQKQTHQTVHGHVVASVSGAAAAVAAAIAAVAPIGG